MIELIIKPYFDVWQFNTEPSNGREWYVVILTTRKVQLLEIRTP